MKLIIAPHRLLLLTLTMLFAMPSVVRGDSALAQHAKDPYVQIRALERHGVGTRRYSIEEVH